MINRQVNLKSPEIAGLIEKYPNLKDRIAQLSEEGQEALLERFGEDSEFSVEDFEIDLEIEEELDKSIGTVFVPKRMGDFS